MRLYFSNGVLPALTYQKDDSLSVVFDEGVSHAGLSTASPSTASFQTVETRTEDLYDHQLLNIEKNNHVPSSSVFIDDSQSIMV